MAPKDTPQDIYTQHLEQYKKAYAHHDKKSHHLALLRLAVFIATFIAIAYFADNRAVYATFTASVLGVAAFFAVQRAHNKIQSLRNYYQALIVINENELLRHNLDLSTLDGGAAFADASHPYTADLGIFGQYSLFQLLNRAATSSGRARLAAWMCAPALVATVRERQESVRELAEKFTWRQDLEAVGTALPRGERSITGLVDWMQGALHFGATKRRRLTSVRWGMTLLSTAALAYFFINIRTVLLALLGASNESWAGYVLPLLTITVLNHFLLKRYKDMAAEAIRQSEDSPPYLAGLERLFSHIEDATFRTTLLSALQGHFTQSPLPASRLVRRLYNVLELFHQRGTSTSARGLVYGLFNQLFLLDVHCLVALDRWKEDCGKALPKWTEALGTIEALSSIGGYCFSHPTFTFPTLTEGTPYVRFQAAGHPLIAADKRVANDFSLAGEGGIALITGSNMAGKSTFLRTLGVNCVLALMGAPICAKGGTVSPLHVFTSMRTQDSLAAGISSFYAELRRIRYLLDYIDGHPQVFFLLDEVLKGTNSHDKHTGTLSLLRQLAATSAFGLVTTHDLSIATVLDSDPHIHNYSFHSRIENGKIVFDYRLQAGPCQEFNASALMKAMGINI